MSLALWHCNHLQKQVDRINKSKLKCEVEIDKIEALLNEKLKNLKPKEYYEFANKNGFLHENEIFEKP